MSASISDIDRYLQSLETEDAYRFVRTIKESEFEVTQLVTRSFPTKSAEREFYAPYVHYLQQGSCVAPSSKANQDTAKCSAEQASKDGFEQSADEPRKQSLADAHEEHGVDANAPRGTNANAQPDADTPTQCCADSPTQVQQSLYNQAFSNRFVRKLIMRESPLGDVYEKLFAAQHQQNQCAYTPYLPFIFECYRNDSHRVVIMQVIDGPNLEQFMRALPFEVRVQQAQKLLPSLCEAARELHEFSDHPIIHRDISPDNIIVCHDAAFLIDFGVAREYKENATHDTVCFGTRIYAAPEQFGYQQSSIRSDVYGLGMVLAYMLKGSEISAVDVSMNFECLDALFASEHKREMGKRLVSVISKAVAFDPKVRFGSPHEFLHAFQEACSGAAGSVVGLAGVTNCVGDGTSADFGALALDSADGIAISTPNPNASSTSTNTPNLDTSSAIPNTPNLDTSNTISNTSRTNAKSTVMNSANPKGTRADTSATTAPTGSDASNAHGSRHWFDHPYKAVRVFCMLWNVCVFLTWGFFSWAAICSGTISYLSTDAQREVINRVLLAGMLPLCFTVWGACLMFKPRWFYSFRLFHHWRWWWNGVVAFLALVVLISYVVIGYHA